MNRSLPLLLLILSLATGDLSAGEIIVSPNGEYKSLATAVRAAAPGSTIVVKPGKYLIRDLVIDKPLTITGENLPELNAGGKGSVIIIRASAVKISGLRIINSEFSYKFENAGIRIEGVADCVIEKNDLFNNFFGIYLQKTDKITITSNTIHSFAKTETNSGNGIHLWYCTNTTINGNTISGHRDGIYLEFSKHNLMTGNAAKRNLRYGLHFMFSDSSRYTGNKFFENGAGVAVMYSSYIDMEENLFLNNKGSASYGLLLKDINRSVISRNRFTGNTKGIYMEASGNCSLDHNLFENNGWALDLMANSMDITFERNSFMGNNFDIATNSKQNFNTFSGNFWDNYAGYDLNKDGYGDVPYHPVSLFSVIITEYKPSLILMRGLFTRMLDLAERVFPSLTPKQLIDAKPAMRRIV